MRIYLTNLAADVTGYKLALVDTRNPGAGTLVTSVTATATSGTAIQATDTSGGTALKWITKPLRAALTIPALPVFANLWGKESNASANASVGATLTRYTSDAEWSSVLATFAHATELTTSMANVRAVSSNATSTAFSAGDRIVVKLNVVNVGTMAASHTVTIDYDGATEGVDGDSFLQIPVAGRVNERQIMTGSVPTLPGAGKGFYQEAIDLINAYVASAKFSADSSVQALLDDLAAERDLL